MNDPVNQPSHYTSHPSGVEAIEIVEWLPFNLGNAVKYLWRAGLKGAAAEDQRKSLWYFRREIDRLRRTGAYGSARPTSTLATARRVIDVDREALLALVLRALFSTQSEYVTVLEILEAAAYVQQHIERTVTPLDARSSVSP